VKKSILVIYIILVLISISIYALFDYIIGFIGLSLSTFTYILIKSLLPVVIGFFISYFILILSNPEIKKMSFDYRKFTFFGIIPLLFLFVNLTPIPQVICGKIFKNFEVLSISIKYIFDKFDIWSLWLGFALGASFKISKGEKR